MKRLLFCLATALTIVSCSNEEKKNKPAEANEAAVTALPEMEIDNSPESWGGDIILHIQTTEKISAETTLYKIISYYNGKPVGFNLFVKRPSKAKMFVTDGITFRSTGDTSNNFLTALAEIYKVKKSNLVFTDSLTVTYADLAADHDPSKPGNWIAAQMKLFFETDEDASELCLNIDEQKKTISLPEKDKDYRDGIVTALSKKK